MDLYCSRPKPLQVHLWNPPSSSCGAGSGPRCAVYRPWPRDPQDAAGGVSHTQTQHGSMVGKLGKQWGMDGAPLQAKVRYKYSITVIFPVLLPGLFNSFHFILWVFVLSFRQQVSPSPGPGHYTPVHGQDAQHYRHVTRLNWWVILDERVCTNGMEE